MFGGFAACRVHLHARRPEASPDLACFGVLEAWKVCCKAGTSKYRTWRRAASVEGACFGGFEGLMGAATRVVEHLSNIEHRSNICRKSIEALSDIYGTSIDYRMPIEHLSNIYRKSIGSISNIYRNSIEHISNIYRTSIRHLSEIYRATIGNLSNIYRTSM